MDRIKGLIFLTGAFSLAGTSVISARFIEGKLGIFTITSTSLLFAIILLLPLSLKNILKNIRFMNFKTFIIIFLQAFFGIFLFRMFLLTGLKATSSAEAGIMTGATPVVTALLAFLILKENMDGKSFAGIFLTIAGILMIQGQTISSGRFSFDHLAGNLLVLCAAVCESLFNILSRIIEIKSENKVTNPLDPIAQTTLVAIFAFILSLIPSMSENPAALISALGLREWIALAWYGFFVTALAFIFWYAGIKRCEAATAAAFSGMMPFTALILSILFLGEACDWIQWLGGLSVITGMLLMGIGIRRKVNRLIPDQVHY